MKAKNSKNKVPFTKKADVKAADTDTAKTGKAMTRVNEKLEYAPDAKKKEIPSKPYKK